MMMRAHGVGPPPRGPGAAAMDTATVVVATPISDNYYHDRNNATPIRHATLFNHNQTAPAIAGLGKISNQTEAHHHATNDGHQNNNPATTVLVVPTKSCQGGLDFKFDSDPYRVQRPLKALNEALAARQEARMVVEQHPSDDSTFSFSLSDYHDAIDTINEHIKPHRSKAVDGALLATGPLMLPLAVWAVRRSRQTKGRKRALRNAMDSFNEQYPPLYMRWNSHHETGGDSFLSIALRPIGE